MLAIEKQILIGLPGSRGFFFFFLLNIMYINFQEVMIFDYVITVVTLIGFYGKALHFIRFLDVASDLNSFFFLSSSVSSLCVFLNPEDKSNNVDEAGELLTCSCTLFLYARAFRLFSSTV